ncbi:GNAT family N-acetyltransferase [Streptomyces sp. TP-A0874]|uniref:GNAT family N-acetyltransferase n=1 Tax=Streptomyces sp. TP-A0874 TaxID=549819 RepID=UPI000A71F066|nr:GNAT family N-acetyltransferase [Streptomyces sp. TP-A0874]
MGPVRTAHWEAEDWRPWRGLRLAALAEAPYAFGSTLPDWKGTGDREERWRSRLEIPGSHDVIAVFEDRSVGMASGVPAGPETIELISMWVRPEARGQRVGDRLIGEIDRWAGESGARTLRLGPVVKVAGDAGWRSETADGLGQVGSVGSPADHGAVVVELTHKPLAVVPHETQLVERENRIGPERLVVVVTGHLDNYEPIAGERDGAWVSRKSAHAFDRPSGGES